MHNLNLVAIIIVFVSFAHKGRGLRERACQPNAPPQIVEQIHGLAQSLQSPQAPPEMHALGRVLAALLSGERHPDLSALPPELASKIEELVAALS